MLKSFTLLFTFLPFFIFCQDVYNKTDLDKIHFSGKAKTIKTDYYEGENINGNILPAKKIYGLHYAHTITTFNIKGNKVKTYFFDNAGTLARKDTSIYDFRDNLIICETKAINGQEFFATKASYTYDDKYRVIKKTAFVITDSSIIYKTFYKYNANGNIIEQSHGLPESNTKNIYKYDDKGRIIEMDIKYPFMNSKKEFFYEYFDKGKMVVTTDYEYFDRVGYQDVLFGRQIIDIYDETKNLIEEDICTNSGDEFQKKEYSYKYDKYGNWVKMIEYTRGEYTVIIREIEYY